MKVLGHRFWLCVLLSATFSVTVAAICCGGWLKKRAKEFPASQVFVFPNSGTINAQSLAFSPDGRFLAIGLAGPLGCGELRKAVRVEDARTKRYIMECDPRAADVMGAVYVLNLLSPDEKIAAGMTLPQWVNSLAFTPDGTTMVAGIGSLGVDVTDLWGSEYPAITPSVGNVVFWDTTTWKKTGDLKLPGAVLAVAISPDGKCLAVMSSKASSQTGTEVTLWDLASRTRKAEFTLDGYSLTPASVGPVRPLAFSPDGVLLAVMESKWKREWKWTWPTIHDGPKRDDPARVVVWNVQTGKEVESFIAGWSPGTSVAFSEDGRRLTTAVDAGIKVWNTKTWDLERHDVCGGVLGPLYDDGPLYLMPAWQWIDGARCGIIRCQDDKKELIARLFSPTKREELGGFGSTQVIAISPDSKSIAAAGTGDEVGVWKIPDLSLSKSTNVAPASDTQPRK